MFHQRHRQVAHFVSIMKVGHDRVTPRPAHSPRQPRRNGIPILRLLRRCVYGEWIEVGGDGGGGIYIRILTAVPVERAKKNHTESTESRLGMINTFEL